MKDRAYIKTPGSYICADESALLGITELEKCVCSLLLLLLPV